MINSPEWHTTQTFAPQIQAGSGMEEDCTAVVVANRACGLQGQQEKRNPSLSDLRAQRSIIVSVQEYISNQR
jgi:hypothetical protein